MDSIAKADASFAAHRRGGRGPGRLPGRARGDPHRGPRPDPASSTACPSPTSWRRTGHVLAAERRHAPRRPRSRSARPHAPAPCTSSTRAPARRHPRAGPGAPARRWPGVDLVTWLADADGRPPAAQGGRACRTRRRARGRRSSDGRRAPLPARAGSSATCAAADWEVCGEPEALAGDITRGRFESDGLPGRAVAPLVGPHLAARRRRPDLGRRRLRVRRLGRRQPRRRRQPRSPRPGGLAGARCCSSAAGRDEPAEAAAVGAAGHRARPPRALRRRPRPAREGRREPGPDREADRPRHAEAARTGSSSCSSGWSAPPGYVVNLASSRRWRGLARPPSHPGGDPRLLRRRHQQLLVEPALDLRREARARRLPGRAVLHGQRAGAGGSTSSPSSC